MNETPLGHGGYGSVARIPCPNWAVAIKRVNEHSLSIC